MSDDDVILEHYRRQAEEHELEPSSTMADDTTRRLEVDAILRCLAHAVGDGSGAHLLEVGCGNGYLLKLVRERFPKLRLTGCDYSPEMVELASRRGVDGCDVRQEDVRALSFPSATFDVVVSERCVINILDAALQARAVEELHRVLKPGGHLVMIEAFTDGADNLNRARAELGLEPTSPPHHNLWFDKAWFLPLVGELFETVDDASAGLPPSNFLSTHYFISRVLYPAVTRREVLYNTEFVKFFQFLPPHGAYSPLQLFFLRTAAGRGR